MALKNHDVPRGTGIETLDQTHLLALRAEIDSLLDLGTLASIDMGDELTVQLRTVKMLQQEALADAETPFGQKAQTAMAVRNLLQDLTKMRTDLHNAERAKAIEGMVVSAFRTCSAADNPSQARILQEVKDLFFEQYERMLATLTEE